MYRSKVMGFHHMKCGCLKRIYALRQNINVKLFAYYLMIMARNITSRGNQAVKIRYFNSKILQWSKKVILIILA